MAIILIEDQPMVGMEGIAIQDGREAMIANSPEEWLSAIRLCHEKGSRLKEMGQKAALFCRQNYDNLEVGRHLLASYQELLPEDVAVKITKVKALIGVPNVVSRSCGSH